MKKIILITLLAIFSKNLKSQGSLKETGTWYMTFFDVSFKESSWSFLGDIQYRNWDLAASDMEQIIIRGAVGYSIPKTKVTLYAGYAHFVSGVYGDNRATSNENRFHEDLVFPIKLGNRFYTNQRFRYEQRLIPGQTFRTRYRYNLFLNIPLNQKTLDKGAVYFAFFNEVFINGQRNIGNNRTVDWFDRNWLYGGLGYSFNKHLKVQLGFMHHSTINWNKNQLLLSLHSKF